ncbi:MAG: site-specific DNA-methyltransferase [Anaerolineae bacterium]|nr:site-specific DNA-methyltransferase [Anaerolineae bacterium]
MTLWESAETLQVSDIARLGTFQDCLKAPIHRWFKYPAGFSYKLVETFIDELGLTGRHWILDPFAGCGTVNVVAKQRGVNSVGIEAHPFVHWVATVKCFWEFDMVRLQHKAAELIQAVRYPAPELLQEQDLDEFPSLLHKCFSEENLRRLRFIRETISHFDLTPYERDLFLLALADTLRTTTKAGAGWPYIAPSKYHAKQERDSVAVFCETAQVFVQDLVIVRATQVKRDVICQVLLHDARQPYLLEEEIDLAITSPPYLNNYDYADRTRLELYFLGWARSWREITEQIRERLIISATTQIRRSDFRTERLSDGLQAASPSVHTELQAKVAQLSEIRHQKGGKKSYDLMVTGYFNDMFEVLQQVYRVLRPGAPFILVLGDSAPYGIYIPTDRYLGELALGIGFQDYTIQPLRRRGEKWRANPQRHNVPLQEVILTLRR